MSPLDSGDEILAVVDECDRVVELRPRRDVHRLGLTHRAAHVFLLDDAGRVYLQFRSATKDQFPRHWSTSAAGHVDPGEDYAECAVRELAEELGLEAELSFVLRVAAQEATGWEHALVFEAVTGDSPRPDPTEVERGGFFELGEVAAMIADPAVPTTPSLDLLFGLWLAARRAGGGEAA